jgi:glycyl-tRNA synthetase beta chain
MPELFLEIGCEEIPAGFAKQALADLRRLVGEELESARLAHSEVQAVGTPRRLAVSVRDVAERQPDQVREVLGPPARVAFDEGGRPTKAALGFARNQGVDPAALLRIETPKGEYVGVRVADVGRPANDLLAESLPRLLAAMPFQKSMRWGTVSQRFVRPIHWIVALLGGEVIPFSFAGVESGRASRGHRFLAPAPFEVSGFADYLTRCRAAEVVPDPQERMAEIRRELAAVAAERGGRPIVAEDLLEEVAFLVEKPFAIGVSFPEEYLEMPPAVLLSVMRKQQRYFAFEREEGSLLPYFAFVAGTRTRDPAVVARGNLKVARARFDDALFYLREDRKRRLEERVEDLSGIVFLRGLGTLRQKVARIESLASALAAEVAPRVAAKAPIAARLAKADLTTGVVKEFPELQGYIGSEYARREGIDAEVAASIYEHYRPRGAADGPPEGDLGAVVSLADKLDSLAGCFRIGQEPTGTADPLALRRQALGVITTVVSRGYHLSLRAWLGRALAAYDTAVKDPAAPALERLLAFFEGRLRALWAQDFPADAVDAVLAAGFDDFVDARARLAAVVEFEGRPDFGAVATTFKRVTKILKDAPDGSIDPGRFEMEEERALHDATRRVGERVRARMGSRDFGGALGELAALGGPVHTFFEKVFVMHENEAVRRNRLALLRDVGRLSDGLLDFGRLQTE